MMRRSLVRHWCALVRGSVIAPCYTSMTIRRRMCGAASELQDWEWLQHSSAALLVGWYD